MEQTTSDALHKFRDMCLSETNWIECMSDGVQKEYQSINATDSVIAVKVVSNDFKDLPIEDVFNSIIDPDFHKEWDPLVIEWNVVDTKPENIKVIQMLVKVPVVTNREFVFDCEIATLFNEGVEERICRYESVDDNKYPVQNGYVRGTVGLSGYLVRKENDKVVVYCVGCSNVGGSIPKWIVNSMSKSAVPSMLKGLKEKVPNYNKWKNQQTK
ncbi:hypothetical protein EIN_397220 [Entamoeba invadens IP1]|uniref:START domain-containing protein n=1 Tax=Entamoeba invadens IP1 TaxID=370355 RepID=A0A0A1U9Z1_ENTIV|nr:hypothetical protein EIN_397220 [Entamoeba invadens IP1]ELP91852.1 hypothetical protein EIN_397220 [Entamoeba invadens IP1]|eukprot:XP_004258623.1 hypothetical protein EIN_397220 [Entamoeba invadens IP1]